MGHEILITAFFTLIVLALGFAWVGGYLDSYQKKAQERALDMMGENKASYGLKSTLKSQKISEEKELSDLQDNIADLGGGLVGKGGIGEGVGAALSEGL